MEEQRQFKRRATKGDLTVYLKDPSPFLSAPSIFPANLVNISEGGLAFKTIVPDLIVGFPVVLEIERTDRHPAFVVNARIVSLNSKADGEDHYLEVGVVFDELQPLVRDNIRSFVATTATAARI